jgi:hypothetical protein
MQSGVDIITVGMEQGMKIITMAMNAEQTIEVKRKMASREVNRKAVSCKLRVASLT